MKKMMMIVMFLEGRKGSQVQSITCTNRVVQQWSAVVSFAESNIGKETNPPMPIIILG
jgi:hypothetical protein